MKLKMINDYILVKLAEADKTSSGGIILTSVEPSCEGTIISIGKGKVLKDGTRDNHNMKIGDVIVFGKASLNMPLEENNETYYVMKVDDIFGKKK